MDKYLILLNVLHRYLGNYSRYSHYFSMNKNIKEQYDKNTKSYKSSEKIISSLGLPNNDDVFALGAGGIGFVIARIIYRYRIQCCFHRCNCWYNLRLYSKLKIKTNKNKINARKATLIVNTGANINIHFYQGKRESHKYTNKITILLSISQIIMQHKRELK